MKCCQQMTDNKSKIFPGSTMIDEAAKCYMALPHTKIFNETYLWSCICGVSLVHCVCIWVSSTDYSFLPFSMNMLSDNYVAHYCVIFFFLLYVPSMRLTDWWPVRGCMPPLIQSQIRWALITLNPDEKNSVVIWWMGGIWLTHAGRNLEHVGASQKNRAPL